MQANIDTVLIKNDKEFLLSELGDEMVMMNLTNGNFLGLNEVGSDILKLIEAPILVSEIISNLSKQYDVSDEECTKDVIEYISLLIEKGIVLIQKK